MKMHYFELTFTNHLAHTFPPASVCFCYEHQKYQRTGNSNVKLNDSSKQIEKKKTNNKVIVHVYYCLTGLGYGGQ